MKWRNALPWRSRHSVEAAVDAVAERVPSGMDYLRSQAGVAGPIADSPLLPLAAPDLIDANSSGEPETWEILCERADQAQAASDWPEAERRWAAMRSALPDVVHSYTGGAIALSALNRHADARQLLSEAAERFPQERAVPLEHGRMAMRQADWPAAEAHWRRALEFDVRPWWVYTELAGALEHQGRLAEAEALLVHAQTHAEDPDEITLFTYPGRLAWKREDWAAAVAHWQKALLRFPQAEGLPAKVHEALMRLAEHDPTVSTQEPAQPGDDRRALMLRFESLGGTGPDGGCEFGCFQRAHNAEPLGLLRWAAVPVASLVAALNARFAGMGDANAITVSPHEGQWEIRDATYGTSMHSFVSSTEVAHGAMVLQASRRMGYLRRKLVTDLGDGTKIFVLKSGWEAMPATEIEALSQAIRTYGSAQLLCVCPADAANPEGKIAPAAPGVFIGHIDFSVGTMASQRHAAWEDLCRRMLDVALASRLQAMAAET